ncbi:hypothetical protein PK35_07440 [Tamlana nanhaiensis]|uniref:Uncharacterized protein n=1 Tax=Neotamlana nanhaiensis TaxID=1382798 RepID=A0A0D7W4L8_9FLAO|nr:hypothetical protein PK35_07440 [Tamlana nanhaiensis]
MFKHNKAKSLIIIGFITGFLIVLSSYIVNPNVFWQFNELEIITTSSLLVIFALCFIITNIEKRHDYFNFSIGLIMYLLCSILIFLTGNTNLVFIKNPYIDIWVFNSLFYILFQVMIYKEYMHLKKDKN